MAGDFVVLTGNGKGKTTYALGLCLKAASAGKKVFLGQFIKGSRYSEIKALQRLSDLIKVEQFGLGRFIEGDPQTEDIEIAQKGFAIVKDILKTHDYDLVVLDEANIAMRYKLFSVNELLAAIRDRAEGVSVVLTGRGVSGEVIEMADYAIEMKEIKHYYNAGIPARIGIEK